MNLTQGHIAQLQDVFHLVHPVVFQLGDVDHPIVARGDFHKGANGQDADHLAIIELAHLGDEANVVHHLFGGIGSGGVHSGDEDGAVVVDVDFGAGVCADFLDGLAAGSR